MDTSFTFKGNHLVCHATNSFESEANSPKIYNHWER